MFKRSHPAPHHAVVTVLASPSLTSTKAKKQRPTSWSDDTFVSEIQSSSFRRNQVPTANQHRDSEEQRYVQKSNKSMIAKRKKKLDSRLVDEVSSRLHYLDLLSPCYPFEITVNEPDEFQSIGKLQCWVVGIRTSKWNTLRKSDGLIVLIRYTVAKQIAISHTSESRLISKPSDSSHNLSWSHIESTHCSAIYSFFNRFFTAQISVSELITFMQSSEQQSPSSLTSVPSISNPALVGRASSSGLNRFSYTTVLGVKRSLDDVFPRSMRTKTVMTSPPNKLDNSYKPKRDEAIAAFLKSKNHNHSSESCEDSIPPPLQSHISNLLTPASDVELSNEVCRGWVLIWWSPSEASATSILSFMSHLYRSNPSLKVYQIDGVAQTLEHILQAIGIGVMQAMCAEHIPTQLSDQRKVSYILSNLPVISSLTDSCTPKPFRLNDSCLLLLPRTMFELSVWPLVRQDHMDLLTYSSPNIRYESGIKQEDGQQTNSSSSNSTSSASQVRSRIARHVRLLIPGTIFSLFTFYGDCKSTFFPSHECVPLYSLKLGTVLSSPVLIEWPDVQFGLSLVLHWCLYVSLDASSNNVPVLVCVPINSWRNDSLHSIIAEFQSEKNKWKGGNDVQLGRVFTSLNLQTNASHISTNNEEHYFLVELIVSKHC